MGQANGGEDANMKDMTIIRRDPNNAVVYRLNVDGSQELVTGQMTYERCMEYVRLNSRIVKPYKIAIFASRKDAKRHLSRVIYCADNDEAIEYYTQKFLDTTNYEWSQLLTGDWRLIAERRQDGVIRLY